MASSLVFARTVAAAIKMVAQAIAKRPVILGIRVLAVAAVTLRRSRNEYDGLGVVTLADEGSTVVNRLRWRRRLFCVVLAIGGG